MFTFIFHNSPVGGHARPNGGGQEGVQLPVSPRLTPPSVLEHAGPQTSSRVLLRSAPCSGLALPLPGVGSLLRGGK
eukprot:1522405-Pyramimonas_sp.AAC.1